MGESKYNIILMTALVQVLLKKSSQHTTDY